MSKSTYFPQGRRRWIPFDIGRDTFQRSYSISKEVADAFRDPIEAWAHGIAEYVPAMLQGWRKRDERTSRGPGN